MKKFVRILALCLAALMLTVSLVACGAPAKDPDKAIEALEKDGYKAVKDDKLLPGIFKIAGYSLDAVVSASKVETDKDGNKSIEHVTIYYFADKENAKKAMAEVEKYASDDKEAEETEDSNWIAPKQSGSIVYYGTKAAVKAAK